VESDSTHSANSSLLGELKRWYKQKYKNIYSLLYQKFKVNLHFYSHVSKAAIDLLANLGSFTFYKSAFSLAKQSIAP
jgi:hypothetical protein